MSPARDTIFALSSGRPPAAIAVVRISGPRARLALETLVGRVPEPRRAALARLRDPESGETIDEALALWFPSPHSETGEDIAELQLHGGRAVIAAVLAALGQLPGFRPAEAGEFTRRAFENGKLDLTAVEGLADLINAETEAQRRQAFRQLKGMLGGQAEAWRNRLIAALALVEAGIDFSDEADVPGDLLCPALAIAQSLHQEISTALAQAGHGERLRDGLVVAIAGPPNAGKSTLLNRIARREAAIVSPLPGTTRDVIEVHLDLDGFPVTLLDTAGVRATDDPVEQEGVRRARARVAAADLVLWVVEAGGPMADPSGPSQPMTEGGKAGRPLAEGLGRGNARLSGSMAEQPDEGAGRTPLWLVRNKTDLLHPHEGAGSMADQSAATSKASSVPSKPDRPMADMATVSDVFRMEGSTALGARAGSSPLGAATSSVTPASVPKAPSGLPSDTPPMERSELKSVNEFKFIYSLSALQGTGLEALFAALTAHARSYFGSESGLLTRERHRHALREAQAALGRALAEGFGREEILAEELRLASRALGRLTGKVDVEDILEVIFRDFCIGK